jgi:hypothetical protein
MLDLTTKLRLNWSDDVLFFYWSALTRLQTLLFRIPNEGVFQFEIQRTRTLMLFLDSKNPLNYQFIDFVVLRVEKLKLIFTPKSLLGLHIWVQIL